MKAISIMQPWAWLIVEGIKGVENRSRRSNYRGELLIHASKRFDKAGYVYVTEHHKIMMPFPGEFDLGGIVGKVDMVDCVTEYDSEWFSGPYGYVFERPEMRTFRPYRGQLGIFNVL